MVIYTPVDTRTCMETLEEFLADGYAYFGRVEILIKPGPETVTVYFIPMEMHKEACPMTQVGHDFMSLMTEYMGKGVDSQTPEVRVASREEMRQLYNTVMKE